MTPSPNPEEVSEKMSSAPMRSKSAENIDKCALSVASMVDEWTQRGWNEQGLAEFAGLVKRRLRRFWPADYPSVIEVAKAALDARLATIGGCSDGDCKVTKRSGMHTNGGCKCLTNPMKAERVVGAYREYVRATTEKSQ
jgi:hypothetical protein